MIRPSYVEKEWVCSFDVTPETLNGIELLNFFLM